MKAIREPELSSKDGSEIEAVVDISISGLDGILRPIYVCQETDMLHLTLADAKRLRSFLTKAINFVEEFNSRSVQ